MVRSMDMNAIRAISMSDNRRNIRRNIRGPHVAGALLVGFLALSTAYALPVATPHQEAGASVHAKNSATPDWMLDLKSRNAGQAPVTVQIEEPGYWI